MLSTTKIEPGFCFESKAFDEKTLCVVNVCGHDSVGRALAKNMEVIPDSYLDDYGLDNLIIPISVGQPRKLSKKYDISIDVVVHSSLVQRCVKSNRLFDHYVTRLTTLAIDWILQEAGIRLNTRTCRLIPGKKYFESDTYNISQKLSEIAKTIEMGMKGELNEQKDSSVEALESKFRCTNQQISSETKRSPLITEVPASTGIKKGFLNDARLYGADGSSECSKPPPDPLMHIPEGLRKKCQIVDTRKLENGSSLPLKSPLSMSTSNDQPTCAGSLAKPISEWSVESLNQVGGEIVIHLKPPNFVKSIKDVDLEASPECIDINKTTVSLPCRIDVNGVSAKFLKSSMVLVVRCPLL
ncbi:putative pre RNA processing PIH1 Nop17 [Trypanosoma vivax]|uniref:PIH1 N-terminal domain-containing protein n=1 Tax=Trypanosoma vivax (strain Y486) TaxID=1055687 RepID=G0U4Y5_TRYVY|nr:hypothetical protein TRVL_06394 [Trypanosoma vivax]KAH8610918.1 putative pre RNA processing PIH1 Nop17 [Trypanosoma vivax]CCC52500.1 conserved hypothetical protein [Trypanosoma vivax Y486]